MDIFDISWLKMKELENLFNFLRLDLVCDALLFTKHKQAQFSRDSFLSRPDEFDFFLFKDRGFSEFSFWNSIFNLGKEYESLSKILWKYAQL